jgi:hypothetical protein
MACALARVIFFTTFALDFEKDPPPAWIFVIFGSAAHF